MSSLTIGLIAFACFSGGALIGIRIRAVIPDHHVNDESREIVKLGAGLIATLAAMILGLLISSAKGSLDAMNSGLTQDGARIILLDRALAKYGPEAAEVRTILKASVTSAIDRIWPAGKTSGTSVGTLERSNNIEAIQEKLNALSPQNEPQRKYQAQAIQIAAELSQSRWVLLEQTQQTLPTAFLVVLLFWVTMLFVAFGMLSPSNGTVIAVLFIGTLSLAGAIFLIMEMNTPITGIIKVSSVPLQKALANLGR